MKIAGLTGGIGSGKSTVAAEFEKLGIPVFYADAEAKALYQQEAVKSGIKKIFGPEVLDQHNEADLKKIASVIFTDDEKRSELNALIHPLVKQRFETWMLGYAGKAPYCIREAAILIESGSYRDCDRIIVVTSGLDDRLTRVMKRDKVSREHVLQRIRTQMSDEQRLAYADYEIINDDIASLPGKVKNIHEELLITLKSTP